MSVAIEIAQKAIEKLEMPIGAVIVHNNKIIAEAHNANSNNPLAHAEIIAIEKALQALQKRNLSDCDIYVTLEPCPMCYYAISLVKMRGIYFGTSAKTNNTTITHNHTPMIYSDISATKCAKLLTNFFQQKRGNNDS
ncbi:nucleoside deaminase [Candidatus Xenohaliotis californiensis]